MYKDKNAPGNLMMKSITVQMSKNKKSYYSMVYH